VNNYIEQTISWCRDCFRIGDGVSINYKMGMLKDSWGECDQIEEGNYEITLHSIMSLRDMIATTIHEMLHIKQWETSDTRDSSDNGELEASNLQYRLADLIWSLGLL